ncbi:MAG: ABC transporter substrate-binding protein [Alphaproteobacteria bacterium]|nr:ABC transporter substrate-binding protein [Alphaproteobacteria bacterium]
MLKKLIKPVLVIALIATLLGIIVWGVYRENKLAHTSATGKEIVRIGAVLPLTKNNTLAGNTFKDLLLMRIAEVPADSKYEYKLFIEDDQFEIRKSILAARKLLDVNDVDMLFTSASGAENAIVDFIADKKVMMFSYLWDDKVPKKSPYAFTDIPMPDQHAFLLLPILQKKNIKTISIVMDNHRGILIAAEAFKKKAADYGIQIVDELRANMDMVDWAISVAKMKRKTPDMYLAILLPQGMETWGRELYRQNIPTSKVLSMNMLDFISDKELFEGAWYTSDSLINPAFSEKYRKRYGRELMFTQAMWGYAALDRIIDIYERYDRKPTTDQVIRHLLTEERDSVVGRIRYDKDGILEGRPILKIIRNGQAEQLAD